MRSKEEIIRDIEDLTNTHFEYYNCWAMTAYEFSDIDKKMQFRFIKNLYDVYPYTKDTYYFQSINDKHNTHEFLELVEEMMGVLENE